MNKTVHDLRERRWGHNVEFLRRQDDGSWWAAVWISAHVECGDYVLVKGRADGAPGHLRYRVRDVKWQPNPGDMYFMTLAYDPQRRDPGV